MGVGGADGEFARKVRVGGGAGDLDEVVALDEDLAGKGGDLAAVFGLVLEAFAVAVEERFADGLL